MSAGALDRLAAPTLMLRSRDHFGPPSTKLVGRNLSLLPFCAIEVSLRTSRTANSESALSEHVFRD